MKNMIIFIWKFPVFVGKISSIFEQACFRNDFIHLINLRQPIICLFFSFLYFFYFFIIIFLNEFKWSIFGTCLTMLIVPLKSSNQATEFSRSWAYTPSKTLNYIPPPPPPPPSLPRWLSAFNFKETILNIKFANIYCRIAWIIHFDQFWRHCRQKSL